MGRAPVTRDWLLTCQGMAERVPARKKYHTKVGSWDAALSFGRPGWMTDKNLLWRKGRAWLKGLTVFILTGWLISYYSSRMGLSEGNSGKYLILSNIDYLERSFCINPNTLSCLCFEVARRELSNFLVEVLLSLSTTSTLYFKARSQILSCFRGSNLLGSCCTLSCQLVPSHPPLLGLEVLLMCWAQVHKRKNHDC